MRYWSALVRRAHLINAARVVLPPASLWVFPAAVSHSLCNPSASLARIVLWSAMSSSVVDLLAKKSGAPNASSTAGVNRDNLVGVLARNKCLWRASRQTCTLHFALYTLHVALYTVHFALYTLHFTHCTFHFTLHVVRCTLYFALCIVPVQLHFVLDTLRFPLHTLHFTLYSLHLPLCTLHFALRALRFVRCTLHFILYILHFTLYMLHFTLSALHFSLCTLHLATQTRFKTNCEKRSCSFRARGWVNQKQFGQKTKSAADNAELKS